MTQNHALRLLDRVELNHAGWLLIQGRRRESQTCLQRVLATMQKDTMYRPYWSAALNLAFYYAVRSEGQEQATPRFLRQWKHRLAPGPLSMLVCDAALFAGVDGKKEDAQALLRWAESLQVGKRNTELEEQYFQITRARVLMARACSEAHLQRLLEMAQTPYERSVFRMQYVKALAGAGENKEAARFLADMERHHWAQTPPAHRRALTELAARL